MIPKCLHLIICDLNPGADAPVCSRSASEKSSVSCSSGSQVKKVNLARPFFSTRLEQWNYLDAKVTTRQAAAKILTPEVMVCDGHEDQVLERFILCKSFLIFTLEQEPACWCDGHRQEGLGEPASVRRVHPGHVSLPQVGFQCVFLR